jgi:hypothetical protein
MRVTDTDFSAHTPRNFFRGGEKWAIVNRTYYYWEGSNARGR